MKYTKKDLEKAILEMLDGCYNMSDTPMISDEVLALKEAILKNK